MAGFIAARMCFGMAILMDEDDTAEPIDRKEIAVDLVKMATVLAKELLDEMFAENEQENANPPAPNGAAS